MASSTFRYNQTAYWWVFLIFLAVSCTRYYKPVETPANPEAVGKMVDSSATQYVILRQGKYSYRMARLTLDNVAMTLNASLSKIAPNHLKYVEAKRRKFSYQEFEEQVLDEVHIFSKDTSALAIDHSITLPLDRIEKIEFIQHDKGRTSGSYLLGGVIATVSVVAVLVAVIAATSNSSSSSSSTTGGGCSCPIVSVYDGQQNVIQGELYTGAITRNIEQKDNLLLTANDVHEEIRINIANDVNERAFTDYTHLSVVEHDQGLRVGVGVEGQWYGLSHPVSPVSATLNDHRDMLPMIQEADHKVCSFDDTMRNTSISELTLNFQPAGDPTYAKLILQLKNTSWLGYIYENYASQFGKKYDQWQDKVNDMPADDIKQWIRDQQIPLSISVNTTSGWKEVAKLNMAGMLLNREMVIPLDLQGNSLPSIEVKLSTGFLFWELDYAAMDFTPEVQFTSSLLLPYSAINESGVDVLSSLQSEDGIYFMQPEMGNEVNITFKWNLPTHPGKSYSIALMSKGYYELVRNYTGQPNKTFLHQFKEPGALPDFSKEKFYSVNHPQASVTLHPN